MDVGNFLALNNTNVAHCSNCGWTGQVGRSSGMVGASGDAECSSGWWFIGGLAMGIAGTLAMQAFGPQMGAALKGSTKRRVAAW